MKPNKKNKKRIIFLLAGVALCCILVFVIIRLTNDKGAEREIVTSDPPNEEVIEEQVELEEDEPEPYETGASEADDSMYQIGEEYILTTNMKVREEASTDSRWKKSSELTEEDKKKAVTGEDAVLAEGSAVKCLEIRDDWMRIKSGWICCADPDTQQRYILSKEEIERIEAWLAKMSEKLGGNTQTGLDGRYTFSSEAERLEYAELLTNGTCVVKNAEPIVPVTDEKGYSDGYYLVKDDKLYLNWGGSVTILEYRINGNELDGPTDEIPVYMDHDV